MSNEHLSDVIALVVGIIIIGFVVGGIVFIALSDLHSCGGVELLKYVDGRCVAR